MEISFSSREWLQLVRDPCVAVELLGPCPRCSEQEEDCSFFLQGIGEQATRRGVRKNRAGGRIYMDAHQGEHEEHARSGLSTTRRKRPPAKPRKLTYAESGGK